MTGLIYGIIFSGITIAILYFTRNNNKINKFLSNKRLVICILLFLTILGFFTQTDFSEQCGCFEFTKKIFSIDYIIYSSISIILLSFAIFIKQKYIQLIFVLIELIYWLFKLFVLKSGYIGGLGIPNLNILDFIGLFFRILFVFSFFEFKYKIYLIPIISSLIIALKFEVNPCGQNLLYNKIIKPKLDKELIEKLQGEWIGNAKFGIGLTKRTIIDTLNQTSILNPLKINTFDTISIYYNWDTTFKNNYEIDTLIIKTLQNIKLEIVDTTLIIIGIPEIYEKTYYLNDIATENKEIDYYPYKLIEMNLNKISDDEFIENNYVVLLYELKKITSKY